MKKSTVMSLRIPIDLLARVRETAAEGDRNIQQQIRRYIKQGVERDDGTADDD